jgi:hypothetical protein
MAGKDRPSLLRQLFRRAGQAPADSLSGETPMAETDLYGKPTSAIEQETLRIYTALKDLAARDDLPPCAARNVRKALACLWQATNDLDLQFEQLYDLGV